MLNLLQKASFENPISTNGFTPSGSSSKFQTWFPHMDSILDFMICVISLSWAPRELPQNFPRPCFYHNFFCHDWPKECHAGDSPALPGLKAHLRGADPSPNNGVGRAGQGQISLIRNTDYLLGLHGAGLSLVKFLSQNSIYQEMKNRKVKSQLLYCILSVFSQWAKTYVIEIKNSAIDVNGNEMMDFDEEEVAKKVLEHMKENNFI